MTISAELSKLEAKRLPLFLTIHHLNNGKGQQLRKH